MTLSWPYLMVLLPVYRYERIGIKKYLKASDQSARCLAINPVERELAVGYSDNAVRIFDLTTMR